MHWDLHASCATSLWMLMPALLAVCHPNLHLATYTAEVYVRSVQLCVMRLVECDVQQAAWRATGTVPTTQCVPHMCATVQLAG